MTQWDLKPPGYEHVTAEQAKLSGMFPLPGAPREQPLDASSLRALIDQPSNQISNAAFKSSVPATENGQLSAMAIKVEEKNRNDELQASAVAMARKMYADQLNIIEEAKKRNNEGAVQSGASRVHNRALSNAASTRRKESPPVHQYQELEEKARNLAQARLARLRDDAAYRSYDSQNTLPSSKVTLRGRRRASSEEGAGI